MTTSRFLTRVACTDQDASKEEREEGYPILLDGVWCFRDGPYYLCKTLCGKRVLQPKDSDDPESAHLEEGVRIKPITVG